jgi:hypothetical protein
MKWFGWDAVAVVTADAEVVMSIAVIVMSIAVIVGRSVEAVAVAGRD